MRLKQDQNLKQVFFETISCHSPDIDYILDPTFEPHCQCPPMVPDNIFSEKDLKDWSDDFLYEIKSCGEVLQRHIVVKYAINMVMKINAASCFLMKL